MSDPTPPPKDTDPALEDFAEGRGLLTSIKARILSGLILALPIAITFWIIYQLYITLQRIVLDPVAHLVKFVILRRVTTGDEPPLPFWWERYIAPLISIGVVLVFLYVLGYFVRTRLARLVDWMMLRVPVVETIYKAVRSVFESLETQRKSSPFKRVVLVEFPHPGMKALAFVTKSLRDADGGRTILCVCILTGVVPPTGFTLFVPEEDVVEVDWSVNEVLQVIVSGGITSPGLIRYESGGPTKLIVPGQATSERPLVPSPLEGEG